MHGSLVRRVLLEYVRLLSRQVGRLRDPKSYDMRRNGIRLMSSRILCLWDRGITRAAHLGIWTVGWLRTEAGFPSSFELHAVRGAVAPGIFSMGLENLTTTTEGARPGFRWNRRWFVLEDNVLFYYSEQGMAPHPPRSATGQPQA